MGATYDSGDYDAALARRSASPATTTSAPSRPSGAATRANRPARHRHGGLRRDHRPAAARSGLGQVHDDGRHGQGRHVGPWPGARHRVRDAGRRPARDPDRPDPVRAVRHRRRPHRRRHRRVAVAAARRQRRRRGRRRRAGSRPVELAAELLEASEGDIVLDRRRRVRRGRGARPRRVGWAELAATRHEHEAAAGRRAWTSPRRARPSRSGPMSRWWRSTPRPGG